MREFLEHTDAIDYAERYWKTFWDELSEPLRSTALSMESGARSADNPGDKKVINALEEVLNAIAPFEEDIVLYRGGEEHEFCPNRPFLSATFLKSTAEDFAAKPNRKLFTIHVRKGSRAIPLCAAGIGFKHEEEVVIATRFIHRKGDVCEYYE